MDGTLVIEYPKYVNFPKMPKSFIGELLDCFILDFKECMALKDNFDVDFPESVCFSFLIISNWN